MVVVNRSSMLSREMTGIGSMSWEIPYHLDPIAKALAVTTDPQIYQSLLEQKEQRDAKLRNDWEQKQIVIGRLRQQEQQEKAEAAARAAREREAAINAPIAAPGQEVHYGGVPESEIDTTPTPAQPAVWRQPGRTPIIRNLPAPVGPNPGIRNLPAPVGPNPGIRNLPGQQYHGGPALDPLGGIGDYIPRPTGRVWPPLQIGPTLEDESPAPTPAPAPGGPPASVPTPAPTRRPVPIIELPATPHVPVDPWDELFARFLQWLATIF